MMKATGGRSLVTGMAIGGMLLASLSIASSETASSYNKQVSGITATTNGTNLFGFNMSGDTVRIGGADY